MDRRPKHHRGVGTGYDLFTVRTVRHPRRRAAAKGFKYRKLRNVGAALLAPSLRGSAMNGLPCIL